MVQSHANTGWHGCYGCQGTYGSRGTYGCHVTLGCHSSYDCHDTYGFLDAAVQLFDALPYVSESGVGEVLHLVHAAGGAATAHLAERTVAAPTRTRELPGERH